MDLTDTLKDCNAGVDRLIAERDQLKRERDKLLDLIDNFSDVSDGPDGIADRPNLAMEIWQEYEAWRAGWVKDSGHRAGGESNAELAALRQIEGAIAAVPDAFDALGEPHQGDGVADALVVLRNLIAAKSRNVACPEPQRVTDAMVDRFLSWPLPESVCADLCATTQGAPHRIGTNLLTAVEARAMLEHVFRCSGLDDERRWQAMANLTCEAEKFYLRHGGKAEWDALMDEVNRILDLDDATLLDNLSERHSQYSAPNPIDPASIGPITVAGVVAAEPPTPRVE